jgi:photosystem II stability/assembly factor-like uncharacterized protein
VIAHFPEEWTMANPHRLYVGTIGEGLFRSVDQGATFVRACNGMFVECHVRALAVHPRNPRLLYLGSEQGLYCSDDAADSWSRMESPLNGLQIWSILLLPHAPEVIVVGTCPARLFRSDDGGQTWTEGAVRMLQECPRIMRTRVTTIIADPNEPDTIWAGVEIDGIYRSQDRGRTWHKLGTGLSSLDIHGLVIVPGNGQVRRLLASTNNDMNLSTDNGVTWQPLNVGRTLPWSYCRGLAQPCGQPETILLGNGDGPPGTIGMVARSPDAGRTWQPWQLTPSGTERVPGRANSTLWNFAVHPTDPGLIYAASVSGGIYRSIDGGTSWEKLRREFGEVRALAWTPAT